MKRVSFLGSSKTGSNSLLYEKNTCDGPNKYQLWICQTLLYFQSLSYWQLSRSSDMHMSWTNVTPVTMKTKGGQRSSEPTWNRLTQAPMVKVDTATFLCPAADSWPPDALKSSFLWWRAKGESPICWWAARKWLTSSMLSAIKCMSTYENSSCLSAL